VHALILSAALIPNNVLPCSFLSVWSIQPDPDFYLLEMQIESESWPTYTIHACLKKQPVTPKAEKQATAIIRRIMNRQIFFTWPAPSTDAMPRVALQRLDSHNHILRTLSLV
jgi:hypothetical protein